jgi:hypothetical protein
MGNPPFLGIAPGYYRWQTWSGKLVTSGDRRISLAQRYIFAKGKFPLDLSKTGMYDENHICNLVSISHIVKE